MNGLLSMIGMQTELEYQMGNDFPFGSPRIRFNVPKGNIPSDKQKCQPKEQHEFTIIIRMVGEIINSVALKICLL